MKEINSLGIWQLTVMEELFTSMELVGLISRQINLSETMLQGVAPYHMYVPQPWLMVISLARLISSQRTFSNRTLLSLRAVPLIIRMPHSLKQIVHLFIS